MKKSIICIIFSMLLIVTVSFSMDDARVKSEYIGYIQKYESFLRDSSQESELKNFFDEIKDIGLYRFYRNIMVGTADYTDVPQGVQKYLSDTSSSQVFENIEQKLAFAGLLCYVQTDLSGQKITSEIIRSQRVFNDATSEYLRSVDNERFTYFGNVIAYSLGLVESSPYTDIKKYSFSGELESPKYFTFEGEPLFDYTKIIKEEKQSIEESIRKISESQLTGSDLEFEIDRASDAISSQAVEKAKSDVDSVIGILIESVVRGGDYFLLRYIAYVAAIIIFLIFFRKVFKYLLAVIFTSEFLVVLFTFNFSADVISSFIYGSFVIVAVVIYFVFMLFRSFGKGISTFSRVVNIILFVFLVLLFFTPYVYVKDLGMVRNVDFCDSKYSTYLLNDTVLSKNSLLFKAIQKGNYDSAKRQISRIVSYSSPRYKEFIKPHIQKIISDYKVEDKFADFESDFDLMKSSENIAIFAHNTQYGTKVLILFFLSLFLFMVSEKGMLKKLSMTGTFASVVLSFISPSKMIILSEVSYPMLTSTEYSLNFVFNLIMVGMSILLFLNSKSRGGKKV